MAIKNIEPCTLAATVAAIASDRRTFANFKWPGPGVRRLEVELDLSLAGTFCRNKISTLAARGTGEGELGSGQCFRLVGVFFLVFFVVLCFSFVICVCVNTHAF
jgi:hypothetical protein